MVEKQIVEYNSFNIMIVKTTEVFQFRGDVNGKVREYAEQDNPKGILHHNLPQDKIEKLINYISKLPLVNWIYVDPTKTEIHVYSYNVPKLRTKFDVDKFKHIVGKILGTRIIDVHIYPVKNVLNDIIPQFPKDLKEIIAKKKLLRENRKRYWNWGKLGKKEVRRKYERMRRKILYSNLKR